MNTPIESKIGNCLLVTGSHTTLPDILKTIERLAESGPVNVVDGGFDDEPMEQD